MKILIASKIDQSTIDELTRKHHVLCAINAPEDELKSKIADRDVLIFRSGVQITADVMKAAPGLKLVIRAGSGVDNVDVGYIEKKGIAFHRIPEPGAKAVAELTFAFMLALSRSLLEADGKLRMGHWAKNELTGYLLNGKVLGIIGAGNIGGRVGQMGAAWGMEVLGCVDDPTPELSEALRLKGIRMTDCHEVIASADYLALHVPLNDSTRGMIGAAEFSQMKKGSYLINLARGGVVDERALYDALTRGGRLRGAALDVHENEGPGKISPLAHLPNVILTPHIGAGTVDTQREIGMRILQALTDFMEQAQQEDDKPRRLVG